ncbi:MAG: lysophospholipid acyltransferase family protein [Candidatus Sericytochromatia bacterium]
MGARIFSVLFLIFFGLSSAVCYAIALCVWLLTVWWDRRLLWLQRFTCLWASLYLWVMPSWKSEVIGRSKLSDEPSLLVCNHQSLLDILVALRLFFPFKFVSKAEVFTLPFIGWNMRLNGYIGIVRGNKDSGRDMLEACRLALSQGSSVFIFPEGTRSASGVVGPFKPGAFKLAHELKLPIQVLVINGSKAALPKNSWVFEGKHHISIEVLEKLEYADFAHLSIDETAEWVRQRILPHVAEHQQVG